MTTRCKEQLKSLFFFKFEKNNVILTVSDFYEIKLVSMCHL